MPSVDGHIFKNICHVKTLMKILGGRLYFVGTYSPPWDQLSATMTTEARYGIGSLQYYP